MEKNKYAPYVLIVYIALVALLFSLFGCSRDYYVGARRSVRCPAINENYFYQIMGVRPPRQYLRNNRN